MTAKPWIVVPLVLPVGDKTYRIEPIGYEDGLTLIAGMRGEKGVLSGKDSVDVLFRLVMGDTWQQMLDDKCSYPVMFRAGSAAIVFQQTFVTGGDAETAVTHAELVWESGVDPERLAAQAAANLKNLTDSKRSTNTATAPATPRRGSSRATTSRTATPRRTPTKTAPRSSGKPSSSSGR